LQEKYDELSTKHTSLEKHCKVNSVTSKANVDTVQRLEEIAANLATMKQLMAGLQDDLANSQKELKLEQQEHTRTEQMKLAVIKKLHAARLTMLGLAITVSATASRADDAESRVCV